MVLEGFFNLVIIKSFSKEVPIRVIVHGHGEDIEVQVTGAEVLGDIILVVDQEQEVGVAIVVHGEPELVQGVTQVIVLEHRHGEDLTEEVVINAIDHHVVGDKLFMELEEIEERDTNGTEKWFGT